MFRLKLRELIALKVVSKAAFIAGYMLMSPADAQAAEGKYTLDPAHTQVMFSVDHLGFSASHGKFLKFSGGFTFDENKPEESAVDVTIDTDSIDMGSVEWENHLKNADFFDVAKHPKMNFKSTKIEKTGDNTGTITGDLTLLGVTKPVVLEVTYNKSGVHPYTKMFIAGFSAKGHIKRSDFNMTYGLPGIGDDIAILLQVEGIRQDPQTQPK